MFHMIHWVLKEFNLSLPSNLDLNVLTILMYAARDLVMVTEGEFLVRVLWMCLTTSSSMRVWRSGLSKEMR